MTNALELAYKTATKSDEGASEKTVFRGSVIGIILAPLSFFRAAIGGFSEPSERLLVAWKNGTLRHCFAGVF